jgi:hypothetical protein
MFHCNGRAGDTYQEGQRSSSAKWRDRIGFSADNESSFGIKQSSTAEISKIERIVSGGRVR